MEPILLLTVYIAGGICTLGLIKLTEWMNL